MVRYKPRYTSLILTYVDSDGNETKFYCDEVSKSKTVAYLINMPVKDSGSRFITDSDIDFEIDGVIMYGEETKRIIEIPDVKPHKNYNTRRGVYRRDKVLVTT